VFVLFNIYHTEFQDTSFTGTSFSTATHVNAFAMFLLTFLQDWKNDVGVDASGNGNTHHIRACDLRNLQ
jgi:hypothetical protein